VGRDDAGERVVDDGVGSIDELLHPFLQDAMTPGARERR
jgi:hypothetical protein